MNEQRGRRLHGASACHWDLSLPEFFYGWRGLPGTLMLWSLLLVVPGVWLRAYAAGYVRKNAELTRTGPYAYTRNPLYLGSMMIAFGFAWAAASWIILVALAALFLAIYLPTIRSEETYLREHFPGFDDYAKQVPRLAAAAYPGQQRRGTGRFSRERYLHHREYNACMGAIAIYAALAARLLLLKR